jgi:uncharacterized membrane protein YagU involved in acid resistance
VPVLVSARNFANAPTIIHDQLCVIGDVARSYYLYVGMSYKLKAIN